MMNWTELLQNELEAAYNSTENLLNMVADDMLAWKPSNDNNWMTVGQLLKHLTYSCGVIFRAFVIGDWGGLPGLPEGVKMSDIKPEDTLPPAEKMSTIESVAEAKRVLSEDKQVALEMLAQAGEERLAHETARAPWDPHELLLGHRLLQMIEHLKLHKAQLFYYLKLQGKPVHTDHLWNG